MCPGHIRVGVPVITHAEIGRVRALSENMESVLS